MNANNAREVITASMPHRQSNHLSDPYHVCLKCLRIRNNVCSITPIGLFYRIIRSRHSIKKCRLTGRDYVGPCSFVNTCHQNCPDHRSVKTFNNIVHQRNMVKILRKGTPILMQMSAVTSRCILEPTFQLMSVSDTFDVCLEHNRNPISVFAGNIRSNDRKLSLL